MRTYRSPGAFYSNKQQCSLCTCVYLVPFHAENVKNTPDGKNRMNKQKTFLLFFRMEWPWMSVREH